jgi:hypothetical protein
MRIGLRPKSVSRQNNQTYRKRGVTTDLRAGLTIMNIAGYEFQRVSNIEPSRAPDGSVQIVMPQARYHNRKGLALKYGAGPFCKFTIPNRYQVSGVYAVTVNDEVRYIGECANLSSRFNAGYGNISPKNCFKGGQETNCRLNNLIYRAAISEERVALLFFPTADYKTMESALRASLKLAWNIA